MTQHDSTKRIPKSLGTETKLFGTYTLTDIAVALLPGVVVLLLMQLVLSSWTIAGYSIQSLTLPIAGIAIGFGALFVYLTPDYMSSGAWLGLFAGFLQRSNDLDHEAAKVHTLVARAHPRRDAIERTDGAFVGMVQVTPPSMALATNAEWQTAAAAFENFLNTTVEFPMQIYSTTQDFPADEYVGQYESRLTDPDVRANPRLAALIKHYVGWYRSELAQRQMTIRDHYIVVPVTPDEVHFEQESLAQKLAHLPIVGLFVDAWFAPGRAEEREAMFEALDERLRRVQAGIREIEGCAAQRVDADELMTLIGSFWCGEHIEYADTQAVLRTRPLVGGADR